MAGEFIVVYDFLPELAFKLQEATSRVVRKAAFDIIADAKRGAPVDTGFLKNSIYMVTPEKSTYDRIGEPVKEGQEVLEEVTPPDSPTEAIVAVAASYGIYVEYGSEHGPAQPYLTPAVEYVYPQFIHALELLEEKMAVAGVAGTAGADIGEE